jgi:hypothetical protein
MRNLRWRATPVQHSATDPNIYTDIYAVAVVSDDLMHSTRGAVRVYAEMTAGLAGATILRPRWRAH